MARTSMVHVRLDEKIKLEATETLASMGLSVSDAINMLLSRILMEKQLPFEFKVPNPETHAAMIEADAITRKFKSRSESSEGE